ncbi:MAG: glycosyltransferase involved in cell wall biosynthesis, partial [Hyphomicrobiaceae bacterium]
ALIAVSETYGTEMRDRLGATTDKLHVVHNGIDAASFAPTGTAIPHPKTIGYLARMCQEKGLDTLIDAFLILKQRGTVKGLRLRVAGVQLAEDQRYVRELQQRIATSGFASDAEFLPNIDRAAKVAFLHTLSTLSVPARYQESFGLYLLEAMAAGVPVVQPRHAAFPEIIEATQGGVLCEPNNPEALANALESVLLNEDLATTLGTQGRQSVATKFSANQMAQKVADICHRLIANESSSTAHS